MSFRDVITSAESAVKLFQLNTSGGCAPSTPRCHDNTARVIRVHHCANGPELCTWTRMSLPSEFDKPAFYMGRQSC